MEAGCPQILLTCKRSLEHHSDFFSFLASSENSLQTKQSYSYSLRYFCLCLLHLLLPSFLFRSCILGKAKRITDKIDEIFDTKDAHGTCDIHMFFFSHSR
eukprot:TRINITY_DN2787_c0_g1::TRINITY_DN2787_c0_g1_i2::g.27327::m.27327 TRINITY_DN2787_c0_g1::TRINITY_DN2787_c0_g1_i2::g.27327  ORF type:complete len:100 (-),score=-7.68,Squash/PF00299.13/0.25,Squash/PF00299.13/1.6e+03 TRINITY_DN2787_c0_g1_i2:1031-1330(-)